MSKKKAKPPKKKSVKKAAKKAVKAVKRAVARVAADGGKQTGTKKTSQATILIYEQGGQVRIRTTPQYITAGPGFVEWTVVNLTGTQDIPVEITWPRGGPWGGQKIEIKDGWRRLSCHDATDGQFKYTVSAGGASEDPEIEIPEN